MSGLEYLVIGGFVLVAAIILAAHIGWRIMNGD